MTDHHDTTELAELLTHTARRLRRGAVAELEPLGVTYAQARVLRVVAGTPAQRMADLAARLEVVPRSVTTMVDALESAGLVARGPDPDDRRSVLVAPTARGRALVARLDAARRDSAERIFGGLNPAQRDALASLLGTLCTHGRCATCSQPRGGDVRALTGAPPGGHGVHKVTGDRR